MYELQIYSSRSKSESRLTPQQHGTTPSPVSSIGATPGANFSPPIQETAIIPDITPMRRGRPAKPAPAIQAPAEAPKPSHSPFRSETKSAPTIVAPAPAAVPKPSPDPFGALDRVARKEGTEDELSQKYPTLEEFTLYHDKSSKFGYESAQPTQQVSPQQAVPPQQQQSRIDPRITNVLADEAFARPSPPSTAKPQAPLPQQPKPQPQQPAHGRAVSVNVARYSAPIGAPAQSKPRPAMPISAASKSTSDLRRGLVDLTKQTTTHIPAHKPPSPVRAPAGQHEVPVSLPTRPPMVSTGTMTSPPITPVDAVRQPHHDDQGQKKSRSASRPGSRGQGLPPWPPSQERESLSIDRSPVDVNADERAQLNSGELPPRPNTKHGAEKEHHKEGSGLSGNSDSRRASREHHRPSLFGRLGSRSSKSHSSHHGNAAKLVDWEKEEATSPALSARASLDMSRPSLDSYGGSSGGGSPWSRQRPTSMFMAPSQLNEDHPRASLDSSLSRPSRYEVESAYSNAAAEYSGGERLHLTRSETSHTGNISSDVDYLRARQEDAKSKHHSHSGKGHKKKGSLGGLSFSGKNLMSGRFGDAFRKFESSNGKSHPPLKESDSEHEHEHEEKSPAAITMAKAKVGKPTLSTIHSPNVPHQEFPRQSPQPPPQPPRPVQPPQQEPRKQSIDIDSLDDDALEQLTDDSSLSPEVRREIERRRALLEEKRVAAAAAEYRRRLEQGQQAGAPDSAATKRFSGLPGGVTNAAMIQNKVQSLLRNENNRPPPKKTASGYGKYTDVEGGVDNEEAGNRGNNGIDSSEREAEQTADGGVSQYNKYLPERPATKAKPANLNLKERGYGENPPPKPPRPSAAAPPSQQQQQQQQQPATDGQSPVRPGSRSGLPREHSDSFTIPRLRTVASMQSRSTLRSSDESPVGAAPQQVPSQTASSIKPLAPPKPRLLRGKQSSEGNLGKDESTTVIQGVDEQEPDSPDWEAKFNQRYPSLSGIDPDIDVHTGTRHG